MHATGDQGVQLKTHALDGSDLNWPRERYVLKNFLNRAVYK